MVRRTLALALTLAAPASAHAQPSPDPEPPAAVRDDFLDRSQMLNGVLAGWAATSIATGAVMVSASDDPFVQQMGIQHVAWGGIDALIAAVAMIVASNWSNDVEPTDTWLGRRDTSETVFWVNAGLDVAYIATGAALIAAFDDPKVRGAGAGVATQGGFLLGFDIVGALVMRDGR
jgi:hypothetical protein